MRKLFFILFFTILYFTNAQTLKIIEQNYDQALRIAKEENKLVFIDFYTTWCAPCEKLDKLVFQNDSVQNLLDENFILLRYDAEKDKVHHLSKKHHASSYPTAVILNPQGFVVNRKYGFSGEDFDDLSKNVLEFTKETLQLNAHQKIIKGYSNEINLSRYPQFYVDYINRDNTKVKNSQKFKDYWTSVENPLSEEFFSTLIYFAGDVPDFVRELARKNKEDYLNLYGRLDTEILFYFLSAGKLNEAISLKSQQKFEEAKIYAYETLSAEWTDDIIPNFEVNFLKAQNKWKEVYEIYNKRKEKGEFSHGQINQFCWEVYEKCEDLNVIKKCMIWMEELTQKQPDYAYLDTYAFLAFKSGDKQKTKEIAERALEIGKEKNLKTKSMEELLEKL